MPNGLIAVDIPIASTQECCMASIKKLSSGTFQLTVRNKLLPKPFYATFNSEGEAEAYGNTMEGLLKAGIVPASLPPCVRIDVASFNS